MQRKDKHRRGSDDEERHVKELPVDPIVGHVCVHITDYSSCGISSHEHFLRFSGLGFVSLGPFHCA